VLRRARQSPNMLPPKPKTVNQPRQQKQNSYSVCFNGNNVPAGPYGRLQPKLAQVCVRDWSMSLIGTKLTSLVIALNNVCF
jgi:hypothetical protein